MKNELWRSRLYQDGGEKQCLRFLEEEICSGGWDGTASERRRRLQVEELHLSLARLHFWHCYRLSAMHIAWDLIQILLLGGGVHAYFASFVSAENKDLSTWCFNCSSVTWHYHCFSCLSTLKKLIISSPNFC